MANFLLLTLAAVIFALMTTASFYVQQNSRVTPTRIEMEAMLNTKKVLYTSHSGRQLSAKVVGRTSQGYILRRSRHKKHFHRRFDEVILRPASTASSPTMKMALAPKTMAASAGSSGS